MVSELALDQAIQGSTLDLGNCCVVRQETLLS